MDYINPNNPGIDIDQYINDLYPLMTQSQWGSYEIDLFVKWFHFYPHDVLEGNGKRKITCSYIQFWPVQLIIIDHFKKIFNSNDHLPHCWYRRRCWRYIYNAECSVILDDGTRSLKLAVEHQLFHQFQFAGFALDSERREHRENNVCLSYDDDDPFVVFI